MATEPISWHDFSNLDVRTFAFAHYEEGPLVFGGHITPDEGSLRIQEQNESLLAPTCWEVDPDGPVQHLWVVWDRHRADCDVPTEDAEYEPCQCLYEQAAGDVPHWHWRPVPPNHPGAVPITVTDWRYRANTAVPDQRAGVAQ